MTETTAETKIVAALTRYTNRSGIQLSEMTGLSSATLYPALFRLEEAGTITSEWEAMPSPRRRRYRLATPEDMIASQRFTRQKPDGTIVEWHQEDESAVTSKAEAVAMIQRTIDFWFPYLVASLQQQKGMSLPDAVAMAEQSFTKNFIKMLRNPFPQRWGITLADVNLHPEDTA